MRRVASSRPATSSRAYPNMRSAAVFIPTIVPVVSMVTMASNAQSSTESRSIAAFYWQTGDGRQKTEDRRRKTEDGGRKTEDGRQNTTTEPNDRNGSPWRESC